MPLKDTENIFTPRRRGAKTRAAKRAIAVILVMVSIGTVSARLQSPPAAPQTPDSLIKLTPSEIELYQRARTLIDWTPSEIQHSPYLHNLRPARTQDQLPMILGRVGRTGTLLFNNFPQVSCDEEVLSQASGPDPLPTQQIVHYPTKDRRYRYIVIPSSGGDFPALEEYRTDLKGNPHDDSNVGDLYMLTSGFASTWLLYLSPADQHDSRFRDFGIETIRNRDCHVVGFAQDPAKVHSASIFRTKVGRVALLVQGLAWIDPESFQVLRIKTWLLAPRADIGLSSQISTVDFHPVQPNGSEEVLWLPRDVTVEIDYRGMQILNTHHCSNFKLFRVETKIKAGG